jgi:hypothetical protein
LASDRGVRRLREFPCSTDLAESKRHSKESSAVAMNPSRLAAV